LFPPVGYFPGPTAIINGMTTAWGNPLPWKKHPRKRQTLSEKMIPRTICGPASAGTASLNCRLSCRRVRAADRYGHFPIRHGDWPRRGRQYARVGAHENCRLCRWYPTRGQCSPLAYGYDEKVAAYCDNGPIFSLSSIAGARGRRRLGNESHTRATGRGTADDPDFTVGRPATEAPEELTSEIWEAPPVTDEQRRNGFRVIPPANARV